MEIKQKKNNTHSQIFRWLLCGLVFSVIYWLIESLRIYVNNGRNNFFSGIISITPHLFFERLFVICFIFLFSAALQSLTNTQKIGKKSFSIVNIHADIVIAGLIFIIAYWIIAGIRDTILVPDISLARHLLFPEWNFFWPRLPAVCILLLFSAYAQSALNKERENVKKKAEEIKVLGNLIKYMPSPILVFTPQGEPLLHNNSFLREFKPFIAKKDYGKAFVFIKNFRLTKAFNEALSGKTVKLTEISFKENINKQPYDNPDDIPEKIYNVTFFPVMRNRGQIFLIAGAWQNISSELRLNAEKKCIQNQLFQAQKLDSIGLLAGGLAHDFNNIITAIQGNADLIKMELTPEEPMFHDIEQIQLASHRASSLVRQLLLFSRKHKLKKEMININDIIKQMIQMLQRLIGEDIIIQTQLCEKLPDLLIDKTTIEQIILNLMINARNAIVSCGKITISTDIEKLKTPLKMSTGLIPRGDYASLKIMDSGCGIPREIIKNIFEPFFSASKTKKGTGLGLSVVYGIVKEHNGFIDVQSEPDKGTIFTLYFPF